MILKTANRAAVFACLAFCSAPAHSQNHDFRFTHLTTDNGLSQSNVICILQDSKGFMWFGTFNGLNRYNGYGFEVFHDRASDAQRLSDNYISALCQDQRGDLWVGTSDGLNRYNHESNAFQRFLHQADDPHSISDNQIETILEDRQGRLWIGTRKGGLELFDPETETFTHRVHEQNDPQSLSSNFIRVLFEDSNQNLWIAHWNGALDLSDESRNAFRQLSIQGKKLTDSPITAMVESPENIIWVATQGDGLYRLEHENGEVLARAHYSSSAAAQNQLSSNTILSLLLDSQNRLWIGSEDAGIDILDLATGTWQHCQHDPFNRSSLNHNSIWSIYEDRTENIWVGTYAYGVNFLAYRKPRFQHYAHHPGNVGGLSHNMVNAIIADKNDNLWIATDGGGISLVEQQSREFFHFNRRNSNLGTDVIVSLFEDSRGRFWVGTWADGLYLFDRQARRFTRYSKEKHGLGSNRILHMLEDRAGGLWLCTFWGGLTYFNPDDRTVRVYDKGNSGLSDNDVRVVWQDDDGLLWIGTDVGLDCFNPQTQTFTSYQHEAQDESSLSKGFVHSIIQTSDATIWVGTTCGLNRFDRTANAFIRYTTREGLPNDEIKCIVEGEPGILWLSTNKGIARFDTKSATCKNYDVADGLQGNEFNARSGCRTARGEIAFGGNSGFNIFQPRDLQDNPHVPPVVITDIKIFNKSIAIGGEHSRLQEQGEGMPKLVLSHRDAVFSFEFVALNYVSAEKNQYAYLLEGFESAWNYVGSKRTATYTNLDPGDYVFRVKASNNDGLWNEAGASMKITITPPFWRTWWAYLLEALVVIAVVSFVLNHFIGRQRLRSALKIEHLQLEKMYELDQSKTRFFANIAHEFHSPLTLILSPLEKLITSAAVEEKIRNTLLLIQRNAKRLQRMTNQLKDFQNLETGDLQLSLSHGNVVHFVNEIVHSFQDYATEHRIRLQFRANPEEALVWFDPDKLDKIVYNLLSNAFKFTPDEGDITVAVAILSVEQSADSQQRKDRASRYLEIRVQDSGIGIPQDKIEHIFQRYNRLEDPEGHHDEGSGVGLAFVHELVQLYHGEISVHSTAGQGSTFTIQIPIDEQYLEENQLVGEFRAASPANSVNRGLAFEESDVAGAAELQQPDANVPVILIVEDDRELRDYLKSTLETRYRVLVAENGQEGFRKAVRMIPDLVVADVGIPEISGIQLCNQLKEDEKTSHIPIILLTAYSSRENILEGLVRGADAYLAKPFSLDLLEAHIVNLLESRRKLREKFSREVLLGPKKIAISDIDEKLLQRIMETIEQHISDDKFNAEALSQKVGISRMQLYRKLRGLTDQTVHEFIRSIRLKRAVQLLEARRMTITQVAYEVGFSDLTYFARCFRKLYKKSPSEYISTIN